MIKSFIILLVFFFIVGCTFTFPPYQKYNMWIGGYGYKDKKLLQINML